VSAAASATPPPPPPPDPQGGAIACPPPPPHRPIDPFAPPAAPPCRLPALVILKNGEVVAKHEGAISKAKLQDWLEKNGVAA